MTALLTLLAVGMLLFLACLHVYWALGGKWPGTDDESLALTVVGGPPGMRAPGPGPCFAVAGLLVAAAMLVLADAWPIELPLPRWLVHLGAWGVAAVLALRGLFGFVEARLRPVIRGTRYARLNVVLYSPLSLALGILIALATRPE